MFYSVNSAEHHQQEAEFFAMRSRTMREDIMEMRRFPNSQNAIDAAALLLEHYCILAGRAQYHSRRARQIMGIE